MKNVSLATNDPSSKCWKLRITPSPLSHTHTRRWAGGPEEASRETSCVVHGNCLVVFSFIFLAPPLTERNWNEKNKNKIVWKNNWRDILAVSGMTATSQGTRREQKYNSIPWSVWVCVSGICTECERERVRDRGEKREKISRTNNIFRIFSFKLGLAVVATHTTHRFVLCTLSFFRCFFFFFHFYCFGNFSCFPSSSWSPLFFFYIFSFILLWLFVCYTWPIRSFHHTHTYKHTPEVQRVPPFVFDSSPERIKKIVFDIFREGCAIQRKNTLRTTANARVYTTRFNQTHRNFFFFFFLFLVLTQWSNSHTHRAIREIMHLFIHQPAIQSYFLRKCMQRSLSGDRSIDTTKLPKIINSQQCGKCEVRSTVNNTGWEAKSIV